MKVEILFISIILLVGCRPKWEETEKLAIAGNSIAQYNLGSLYFHGHEIEQDYTKAAKWFEAAAAQGDMEARYNLATMFHNGTGVKQDFKKAYELYTVPANKGLAHAQNNLATLYSG